MGSKRGFIRGGGGVRAGALRGGRGFYQAWRRMLIRARGAKVRFRDHNRGDYSIRGGGVAKRGGRGDCVRWGEGGKRGVRGAGVRQYGGGETRG